MRNFCILADRQRQHWFVCTVARDASERARERARICVLQKTIIHASTIEYESSYSPPAEETAAEVGVAAAEVAAEAAEAAAEAATEAAAVVAAEAAAEGTKEKEEAEAVA